MKKVHFNVLDFDIEVPEGFGYTDMGYTSNMIASAKKFVMDVWHRPEPRESDLAMFGFYMPILVGNRGGVHIGNISDDGARKSYIFYSKFSNEADMHVRVHEELHAVSYLGLRKDLEKIISEPCLEGLLEEEFCDQAGIYVLQKRGIDIPADLNVVERAKMRVSAKRY